MAERKKKEEDWTTWAAIAGGIAALGALTWYYLSGGGILKVTKSKIVSVEAPSSAAPGQQVQVKVKMDIVDTEGKMWGQIVDAKTGQVVGQKQTTAGPVKEAEQTWALTMPSSTWQLRAESSAVR